MTLEEKIILLCTRQSFSEKHLIAITDLCQKYKINWKELFTTACEHSVSSLVYYNLRQYCREITEIPPAIDHLFKDTLSYGLLSKLVRKPYVHQIITICYSMGYKVMLIKGLALDILIYDKPWLINSEDADVIVWANRSDLAHQAYSTIYNISKRRSIEVDFVGHHDVTMNGSIMIDWSNVWNDGQEFIFDGYEIMLMCAEDMLITACISVCRKRFRLKQICDVAEIVSKTPHLNWKKVIDKSSKYGCIPLLYVGLAAAIYILDADIPRAVLDNLKIPKWKKWLIQRSLQSNLVMHKLGKRSLKIFGKTIDLKILLLYVIFDWRIVYKSIRIVSEEYFIKKK